MVLIIMAAMSLQAQDNGQEEPRQVSLSAQEEALVNGNNDFAFRLFRQTRTNSDMVLSPLSVTYALGLLNNGAVGQTRQEICQTLGFGDAGADGINAFCKKMLTELPTLDELTKVMISNAIYLNEPRYLLPDFEQKAHDYYQATTETRNFDDGETMNVINQWASDHTMGMIDEVLNEDSFDPCAASYLFNAVYFKGVWTLKFDKEETQNELFDGAGIVPMMHQTKMLPYMENEQCQALILPYGNQAYTMTILLPREGKTVADVASTLNAEQWNSYRWMRQETVDVKLPRMDITTSVNLVETMTELGMPRAFDPMTAEIPDYCNIPQYISNMFQVAKIKLDEEGTEAAAVTVIETTDTAIPDEPKLYEFHANRPFLYVISEQSTGVILFIGQFMGAGSANSSPASVSSPVVQQTESVCYDLAGRRLSGKPAKGFYIENGRKVIR